MIMLSIDVCYRSFIFPSKYIIVEGGVLDQTTFGGARMWRAVDGFH